ncbi:VOC family protein [Thermoactinospora rubra]|uniref:VOC family protein n=1 Tax=Thermoactinospora rubra TaxID=1088767 RepID=UPI000A11B1FF|nr:VOC family protein [Thermoactinospora rubra]
MALHRLTTVTIGVSNLAETAAYYADFGLTPTGGNAFATVDGGEQLRLVHASTRRLVELGVGVDDPDDIGRITASLARLDLALDADGCVTDPGTRVRVRVSVAGRISREPAPAPAFNGPGRAERVDARAPAVLREEPVRPRKLGHVVLGSTDQEASRRLFTEGLGFKVSDEVPGIAAFLRCSADHHNLLVQPAPVPYLHHTSWEVEDVDEIGRGAHRMLEGHPERHVWGLGRHHIGSNFFWYLKDPAGTFSEYYSDLDCVVDDAIWKPEVFEDMRILYSWGPPVPPSFIEPEDLAALMAGAHGS